ncbi:TetR/AcrR family transcriptional regulator [Streptomyces griseorubiginosus]|uniref:TetR/AcrR family transcriptional regulator n=1 Tax=Streptomyces griseorubiginosus TaxID=67304 RepID=UPI003631F768
MPRVAEVRKSAAAPSSERQNERWDRMLAAAAELGAHTAYEQVQMQEIARVADVALGTLYRYFPSKARLFTAVFNARIARFVAEEWPTGEGGGVQKVGERLAALTRRLVEQPLLCGSMVRATTVDYCDPSEPHAPMAEADIYRATLRTLGVEDPGPELETAVRMLVYGWWGVLVSCLSGRTSPDEARQQIELAARRLLAGEAPGQETPAR